MLRRTEVVEDQLDTRYQLVDDDDLIGIKVHSEHDFDFNNNYLVDNNLHENEIAIEIDDVSEGERDQNEDLDKSYLSQVYLSVIWHGNKIGLSYYDSNNEYIYYLPDMEETTDFKIINLLLADLKPCMTITNSNADEGFAQHIKSLLNENNFQAVPSQDFNYETCKKRIVEMKIRPVANLSQKERLIYFKTIVDFDCVLTIRSMGALLKYLDRLRINVELEDQTKNTPIRKIKSISIENILHIDENSLHALQIFHSINHPSIYKTDANREGFSLFGLFSNKLRTKYGATKLRSWLLKPTRDHQAIKQRHCLIEFFLNTENMEYKNAIETLLKGLNKNISLIFRRMKQKQLAVCDWNFLNKTTVNLIKLLSLFDELRASHKHTLFDEFFDFDDNYSTVLNHVLQSLIKIIDFKQTNETKRVCIFANIDFDLDTKKETYKRLPEYLTKAAYEQLNILNISECNINYLPQIGFLLVVNVSLPPKQIFSKNFCHFGLCCSLAKIARKMSKQTLNIEII
jgi:DNA mismatch repair protein MSH5